MVSPSLIREMHAAYMAGASFGELARRYGRPRSCLREHFKSRGLFIRPFTAKVNRDQRGRILPLARITPAQLTALIASIKRLQIPEQLRTEWRHWPLTRRADFVRRVRAHLRRPQDAPTAPYSSNVEPFDYGSSDAHALARAENVGRNSRTKAVSIHLISQGVIYHGNLWFWVSSWPQAGGAYYRGPYREGIGRPALHRAIYQEVHGPIPPSHCVVMRDGNPNNLKPSNLKLIHRREEAWANRSKHFLQRSRSEPNLLLEQFNRKTHDSNHQLIRHLVAMR